MDEPMHLDERAVAFYSKEPISTFMAVGFQKNEDGQLQAVCKENIIDITLLEGKLAEEGYLICRREILKSGFKIYAIPLGCLKDRTNEILEGIRNTV